MDIKDSENTRVRRETEGERYNHLESVVNSPAARHTHLRLSRTDVTEPIGLPFDLVIRPANHAAASRSCAIRCRGDGLGNMQSRLR